MLPKLLVKIYLERTSRSKSLKTNLICSLSERECAFFKLQPLAFSTYVDKISCFKAATDKNYFSFFPWFVFFSEWKRRGRGFRKKGFTRGRGSENVTLQIMCVL